MLDLREQFHYWGKNILQRKNATQRSPTIRKYLGTVKMGVNDG